MVKFLAHSPLRQHFTIGGKPKRPFSTLEEAYEYAEYLRTTPNASKRRPYNPYQCDTCDKYHVGRKPAK